MGDEQAVNKEFDNFIGDIEWIIRNVSDVVKRRGRDMLKDFNITPPQFIALQVLTQEGELTIGELGDQLYLACSTVTDLVDRMEKSGLVKRYRDERDRRIVRVQVLDNGYELIKEVISARQTYLARVLEDLSAEERQKLKDALTQLNDLMGDS